MYANVLIIDDSMDSLIYRRKSLVRNIFSVYGQSVRVRSVTLAH